MAKYNKRPDGRYETKITLGYDASGKPIRKSIYGKSPRAIDDKIFELKQEYQSGIKTSDMLFYDYATSWLKTYKADKSINTKAMYSNIIEKHLKGSIGMIPLNAVTKSDIQGVLNSKMNQYETCNKILLTVKQILKSAIDDDLITKNPAASLKLSGKPRNEKRVLTSLEKKAIIKADFSDMQKAFVYILFYCGLRREEALALTVKDFDFKKNILNVSKAIVFDGNNPVLSDTKNSSSVRTVPLPAEALPFFKSYTEQCGTLYLYTKQDGSVMTHSSYVKFWSSIIKTLNFAVMSQEKVDTYNSLPKNLKNQIFPIQGLTAHIFRHNYATMLYYSGISIKKAAALMGHTDTKMIMQVYAHLDDEKEQAMEKLNSSIKLA